MSQVVGLLWCVLLTVCTAAWQVQEAYCCNAFVSCSPVLYHGPTLTHMQRYSVTPLSRMQRLLPTCCSGCAKAVKGTRTRMTVQGGPHPTSAARIRDSCSLSLLSTLFFCVNQACALHTSHKCCDQRATDTLSTKGQYTPQHVTHTHNDTTGRATPGVTTHTYTRTTCFAPGHTVLCSWQDTVCGCLLLAASSPHQLAVPALIQ